MGGGRWRPARAAAAPGRLLFWKLWLDQSLREMEVLKIIGALIMKKKVKEIQIKSILFRQQFEKPPFIMSASLLSEQQLRSSLPLYVPSPMRC